MALLFMEGFDGYVDLQGIEERADVTDYNDPWVWGILQPGRINGESAEIGYHVYWICSLPQASTATQWTNFAIRFVANYSTGALLRFKDSAGTTTYSLYWNQAAQAIEVRRGTTTVLATTSTISLSTFHAIGLEVFVDDTVGTLKLWVDGDLEQNLTNQDTKGGTTTTISTVEIGYMTSATVDIRYDDFIFGDDSGTDLTSHPGDCHIEMVLPDGDGATNNWTAVGAGTTNADRVDEQATDDDTTYVHASTAADKDLYTFANLGSSPSSVYAVQIHYRARKEGTGFREMNGTIRSNVTETDGTAHTMTTDYQWFVYLEENDPNGGINWTESAVNAMQAGVEIAT